MKYGAVIVAIFIFPSSLKSQDIVGSNFPKALDSFYLQVKFVDGSKENYEAYKTMDTTNTWLLTDTVLYNMMTFNDSETMFMFLMHVKGTVAKNFTITPMLQRDISNMLVNRQLYLRDSMQGRLSHNY